jgi:hypothetical protein
MAITAPALRNMKTLVNAAIKRVPQLDTTGLQAQPQTVVIDVRNQTS